jgi:hypothetical protein
VDVDSFEEADFRLVIVTGLVGARRELIAWRIEHLQGGHRVLSGDSRGNGSLCGLGDDRSGAD